MFNYTQKVVLEFLNQAAFLVGLIGVTVIIFGVIHGFYLYVTKRNFWKIRVILVKHILLGLDFLISRDIIETVILKSNSALWIDLASLVLIIAIRVIFSIFAEKEMNELMEDKK